KYRRGNAVLVFVHPLYIKSNWTDQSGRILMTRRSRRQRHLPRTAPETQEKTTPNYNFCLYKYLF
ncbi:hypothetical protein, partial [Neisseria meningitidis]|uniref:hypothetical protein n=1 Tax=Neisseria meningitidis TaxID=487 RepID=UPI001E34BDFB